MNVPPPTIGYVRPEPGAIEALIGVSIALVAIGMILAYRLTQGSLDIYGMVEGNGWMVHCPEGHYLHSPYSYYKPLVLDEEYKGPTLGITDADLKTEDDDAFYNSILGGKNPKNDVAVVSTNKLAPMNIATDTEYELFIDRTLKVSLHEVGHNFGLTDHASYQPAADGLLCPMSRGEFNKFGYRGYVKVIVDGRGPTFCDECFDFIKNIYGLRDLPQKILKDGLVA